jgi:hypothetical protein
VRDEKCHLKKPPNASVQKKRVRVKSATANGQRLQPAECLHCGQFFQPRRQGHVFCSNVCRYRGERPLGERGEIDVEAVKRLFEPSRDPDERVLEDDWIAGGPDPVWRSLYAHETVGDRRRWYMSLLMDGRL